MGQFVVLLDVVKNLMSQVSILHMYITSGKYLMVSIEKCLEILQLESESGYKKLEEYEKLVSKGKILPIVKKLENWPSQGKIDIKDLKVKYREDLDYVLKGINFEIKGGEKVGVVGRTGAGKNNSFLLSL